MNVPAQIETAISPQKAGEIMEAVVARGDLSQLTPEERGKLYIATCESLGLNPMTRPFEYITLQGRMILYARKDCTDQLRTLHGVSVIDLTPSDRDGLFIVAAKVVNIKGRTDMATGAVNVTGLRGEALANAIMKAETKAKRRATLSICGLGFLDETEIDETPERLTKPKQEPKFSRAEDAKVEWEKKFNGFKDHIRQQTDEEVFLKWMTDKKPEISCFPEPYMIKELHDRCKQQLAFIRSVALADQVVHEEDGQRPATPEDFEPAPLPPEPHPASISQKAIRARENLSADEIADYLRS